MSDEITSVLVDPYALAPERIKYPDGHICDILREQAPMMTAAAHLLDVPISYNETERPAFVGVYVPDVERDPADLLRLFEQFKIAFWKWSKYRETFKPANGSPAATDPRD